MSEDKRDFEEVYPPDPNTVIQVEPTQEQHDQIVIYRNESEEGTPWILKEEGQEVVMYTGLTQEQKAAAHDAIHRAIHESTGTGDSSMFR